MSPLVKGPSKKGRPPGSHNKPKWIPTTGDPWYFKEWTWSGSAWVKEVSEDPQLYPSVHIKEVTPSEQLVTMVPSDEHDKLVLTVEEKMSEGTEPKTIAERLAAPFPPERVRWRVSKIWNVGGAEKSLALAYIDARDVMDRLDEVFGVGGWQRHQRLEGETNICTLSVRVERENGVYEWVEYEDVAEPTDFEETKGGSSDSFKRSAVNPGVGRYLYGLGNTVVTLEDHKIPQHEIQRLVKDVLGGGKKAAEPGHPLVAVDEYMSNKRKEVYLKAVAVLGKESAESIMKGISEITGEWATLDVVMKMKYLSIMNDSLSSLLPSITITPLK